MTSVGTASVEIVGDVSKFASQVNRDVKAALAGLDVKPITPKADVTGFQRSIQTAAADVSRLSGSAKRDLSAISTTAGVTGTRISESFAAAAATGRTAMAGLATSASASLASVAAKLGPIAGIGVILSKGFARLTTLEDATAKLIFLGSSAEEAAKIVAEANASVKGSAFGLGEAVNVAAAAVASGVKPGADLARELRLVADSAQLTGVPLEEMGRIFNKVAASNKLFNEEISQLQDRGVPIVQNLAKNLGVPADEVRKLASEGKISFKQFQDAMSVTDGAAKALGDTTTGSFKNMSAAVGRLGAAILDPAFATFGPILQDITKFLEENRTLVTFLVGAYLAYQAVVFLVAIATKVWAAAQVLLNIAMSLNPIGIVIILIGLLVVAIVIAYQKSETFRNIVTAAFEAVKIGAQNLWKAIQNAFTFIVNAVTNTKNGIVNGFNAVVDFFKKLPGRILGALGDLGSLLFNAGKNIVQGLIDGLNSMLNNVKNAAKNVVNAIKDFLPFSPAKMGPLAGSGSPMASGMRIGEMLAEGLGNSIPAVAAASRQVTGAISGQLGGGGFGSPLLGGAPPMTGGGFGGSSVMFSPGAVSVSFNGVVPTEMEAQRTGEAVGVGIAAALQRRDMRVQMRAV